MKQSIWHKSLPLYLLPALILLGVLFLSPTKVYAASLTVDSILDTSDASAGDGSCDDGSGNCTLRAAIEEANALAGADTINFNISGSGVHTFTPGSAYDTISDELTIDGYSQPGASANTATSPNPFNGTLTIEIDGTSAGSSSGLAVGVSDVTIKGLVINRFTRYGIDVGSFDNILIQGNYIGIDPTGLIDRGNTLSGINQASTGTGNIVGGTTAASRNIISGNQEYAVGLNSNLLVQGNYFGLDATGAGLLANVGGPPGANLYVGGNGNTIGGSTTSARNVIAGSNAGILIFFGSSNNVIRGNFIGTNASGSVQSGFGAAAGGIFIVGGQNNIIGGTAEGEGNVIAGNGSGIGIGDFFGLYMALNNSVIGNSIYGNDGGTPTTLGIDLLGDTDDGVVYDHVGVTANDAGDEDGVGGSNQFINFPVLNSATKGSGEVTVNYNLDINDSEAGATGYRVEFFANSTSDNEGEIYLGSDTISGDVTGQSATLTLPSGVPDDYYVTATTTMTDDSTDGFGHTSEFSASVEAVANNSSSNDDTESTTLADTGQNATPITFLATLLLTVGVSSLAVVTRNRLPQDI